MIMMKMIFSNDKNDMNDKNYRNGKYYKTYF